MQPFSLEKPVAHLTASKFSAVLIGRIVSRYIFNSVDDTEAGLGKDQHFLSFLRMRPLPFWP